MPDPASVVRGLIEAFSAQREEDMRAALAEDMTAYVTNAEGGVDRVHGRDSYVRRLLALKAPVLSVTVTQSVTVSADQGLLMVEIRAERKGRSLHNFSAFLATVRDDQVSELWMVEALPAYSDEFWQ
jgi:ketosteroid isomerase-like protein